MGAIHATSSLILHLSLNIAFLISKLSNTALNFQLKKKKNFLFLSQGI